MKTIHFPGNHGQRCQAKYAIGADRSEGAGTFGRTTILFVADEHCPGKTFPNFGDSPDYLLNKVLDQELAGCRLQFIDVFYAGLPDELGRRDVYRWGFKPDLFDPKREDSSRKVSRSYRSVFDRIKAGLNMPGAAVDIQVSADNPCAGIYPVLVSDHQPLVAEGDRLELLNRFNVLSR
jgi:hypothetical protein